MEYFFNVSHPDVFIQFIQAINFSQTQQFIILCNKLLCLTEIYTMYALWNIQSSSILFIHQLYVYKIFCVWECVKIIKEAKT
jgi:hypothetical protein